MNQRERLDKEGIVLIPNFISKEDIDAVTRSVDAGNIIESKEYIIGSPEIQAKLAELLGKEYEFHDYIFLIKKSQFHTCHRDYNGDFFNEGQQYPSYTIIIYLEDMHKCLDIIPRSHNAIDDYNYNMSDYTQTVYCKAGDVLIFNANLIHNGSLNDTENHKRIQMKISHKNDKEVLQFYNNYNKVLNNENPSPWIFKHAQKHITCQFPIISQYVKQYDNNKSSETSQNTDLLSGFFSPFFAKLETVDNRVVGLDSKS